ncbi:MAG: P-loop NTPase, partial [Spirochaetes bacterium]|nr:P-loop NTPase [Spirochaetota bacterium]
QVLGVVENMSALRCPHCGGEIQVFKQGGGETMSAQMGVPFLGSIPLHPAITELGDRGEPFSIVDTDPAVKKAFEGITDALIQKEDR